MIASDEKTKRNEDEGNKCRRNDPKEGEARTGEILKEGGRRKMVVLHGDREGEEAAVIL